MKALLMDVIKPQNLLIYLFAYGFAAMPTSYWVAKIIHRSEIERHKMHNHSATYIWRHLSFGSAIIVLFLDVLKGFLPSAIALSLDASALVIALTGFVAVLGHCFSIVLRFNGGHGGATYAGALLVLAIPVGAVTLLTNYLMIMLKLRAGLASMIAALVGAIMIILLEPHQTAWPIVIAMVAIIFIRDRLSMASSQTIS